GDGNCQSVIYNLELLKRDISKNKVSHKLNNPTGGTGQVKVGEVCIDNLQIRFYGDNPEINPLSKQKTQEGIDFSATNSGNIVLNVNVLDKAEKDKKIEAVWGYLGDGRVTISNKYVSPVGAVDVKNLQFSEMGIKFLQKQEAVITHVYNDAKGANSKYCDEHKTHKNEIWFCTESNHYVDDLQGKPTIGLGHLIKDQKELDKYCTQTMTMDDCMKLFEEEDLPKYETPLKNAIDVELSQYQYDALLSFVFNTGTNRLRDREIFKKYINKKDLDPDKIKYALDKWHTPSIVIPRRDDEINLFNNGIYTFRGTEIK
ncbi:Phage-related lysozyme (muramidase), GH24 family, partial [Pseudarcicella hirudinis]